MKKEGLKFTILASIWLLIFDSLIIKKVVLDYIIAKNVIAIRPQFFVGNFALYPPTTPNIITKLVVPLIIYNIIIASLIYLNYKFKQKLKNPVKSKINKRSKLRK
ncbi:MAG TPA: hypothetical protein VJH20_04480 [Candidatus Nanoarchaeia archaeon]|nr:hypothetical protein [Candidatus Nanoarchaeia archaeon]